MPALVNYTPRFRTCASRLLLACLSLFSRCSPSYFNSFFTAPSPFFLPRFLSPFSKLLARLSGFIVFPLDAALFIPHSPRIRGSCALAGALKYRWIHTMKKGEGEMRSKTTKRKKNAVIRGVEENDRVKEWRWKRRDKRVKPVACRGWAVTALRDADFAERISVFVSDSH